MVLAIASRSGISIRRRLSRIRWTRWPFWRSTSWPIEYGLAVMRFAPLRLLAFGRRLPGLLGHTGSTGSGLWHGPGVGLMLAGTVDRATAVTVHFRPVPNGWRGWPSTEILTRRRLY